MNSTVTLTLDVERQRPRCKSRAFGPASHATAAARLWASVPPHSLRPGWYLFKARLATDDPIATQLLIDYGREFGWFERRAPRFADRDGTLRVVVVVKRPPRSFGLLAGSDGRIPPLEQATLQPLGRARALMEMLAGIRRGASRRGSLALLAVFRRFMSTLLRAGRQAAADELVAAYERTGRGATGDYAAWHSTLDDAPLLDRDPQRPQPGFGSARTLSVLMTIDPANAGLAVDSILSVRMQTSPAWQLCIACSPELPAKVLSELDALARADARIVVVAPAPAPARSVPWLDALSAATGTHCARLECGDRLAVHAVRDMAAAVELRPEAMYLYSDHDFIDGNHERHQPAFKPDWSPEVVCQRDLLLHLAFVERGLLKTLGDPAGGDPYDLALRACDAAAPVDIVHVPRILYHRLRRPSAASADAAAVQALRLHLERTCQAADVAVAAPGRYRLVHALPAPLPSVDIVLPTRDQHKLLQQCVDGLLNATDYPGLHIRILDNGSIDPRALDLMERLSKRPDITVQRMPGAFNFSRLVNRGVRASDAQVVCLLNDDVVPLDAGWLREMVSHALRPGIGAVGSLLFFPDGAVQHAGVVTGIGGVAGHADYRARSDQAPVASRLATTRNATAVTAACMVVTRERFERVGGFDERLPVCYNDVDFCLRMRQLGYFNLWTPFARLRHHESASRGPDDTPMKRARHQREFDRMLARWGDRLSRDPAYNPNLSLYGEPFELAHRPRATRLDPAYPSAPAALGGPHVPARAMRMAADARA